jgi:hypothetical protein
MAADQSKSARQIGGDEIISEILRNADAGQFRMRRSVIIPAIYQVYLNQADYDLIRPVFNALRDEARAALKEQLDELNRRSKPGKLVKMLGFESTESAAEYRILDKDFSIEFFPDVEGTLAPGDLEVRSDLAAAPAPEFDGAMTRHVTRRNSGAPAQDPEATVSLTNGNSRTSPGDAPVYGWLRYTETNVDKEYRVLKNEIAIGRGGKAVWVDLKLETAADVSREHCRIRRDADGRNYIIDVSQFGTAVNGHALVPNKETELPSKATINLANVITLEWEKS